MGNTVARQTVNADASILFSDFALTNDHIEGTWRVDTAGDDDFMGFVFGYQDEYALLPVRLEAGPTRTTRWGFAAGGDERQGRRRRAADHGSRPLAYGRQPWPRDDALP